MIRIVLTIGLAGLLAGCVTTQTADESPSGVPVPFEVTLQARHTDGRAVYYELRRDRSLLFGGGRDGNVRKGDVVGKITDEQAREVWRIVERSKLLDASGTFFADYEKVRYEFAVTAAGEHNSITTVDDRVPGLAELDKRLFELQSDIRYADVIGPIDERIRKAGGAVQKK